MDRLIYVDKFKTTLTATLNPGDTVATVLDASRLASIAAALAAGDRCPITLENSSNPLLYENTYCTGVSGSQLTLVRAQEGTTAQTWPANTTVANRVTAQALYTAPVFSYATRSRLRSLSPVETALAVVDGLGLFTWEAGSNQPEDDETCFATASPAGCWLMRTMHWDVAFAILDDEFEVLRARLDQCDLRETATAAFKSRFCSGSAAVSGVSSIGATVTYTITVTVPGALVGSPVAIAPVAGLNAYLLPTALVSAANTVTIKLYNIYAGGSISSGMPNGTWNVVVINP